MSKPELNLFRCRRVGPQICLVTSLACLLGVCEVRSAWAKTTLSNPVRRGTNDRDADVIAGLIRDARFDDAVRLCLIRSRGCDPESDLAAKWAIRHSEVLTARQMASDQFGDTELVVVQGPVQSLLDQYPNHRRRLFLQSQLLGSRRQLAYHAVLRAAVSPADDDARESAARKLLAAMSDVLALADEVRDAGALLDSAQGNGSKPNTTNLPLIGDLMRLGQRLQVDAVSLALVQTDLFEGGSPDRIATATKAEQAADDAIARLPFGSQARKEVERLKVEAIFRGEQLDRADLALRDLARMLGEPLNPKVLSLLVRLRLAQGRLGQAAQVLQQYYGDRPESAARSAEMDLARLEYLLIQNQRDGVGSWLDAIQRRGGAYARRRAEAVSLARLRLGPSNGAPTMDPSLIAAQGQDWLRRGDASRGGDLLAAAAAAEKDPDRAIARAGEAAAALVAAQRTIDAAGVLADVSVANPTGKKAAATHLQAIVMLSQSPGPSGDVAQQIETLLKANLRLWPSGNVATSTRAWLNKLLVSQDRYADAAKVVSSVPVNELNDQIVNDIAAAWIEAIQKTPIESSGEQRELRQAFQSTLQPMSTNEAILDQYRLISALYLTRQSLSNLPSPGQQVTEIDRFINELIEYRDKGTPLTTAPPKELREQVESRLMRDGREYSNLRPSIASTLSSWTDGTIPSLAAAEQLMWNRQLDQAVKMLEVWREASDEPATASRQAAILLTNSQDPAAQREAIQIWDELASGSPQGSDGWHEAKLAAITLLGAVGDAEEAYRRAKFIQLTQRGMSDEWKRKYASISKP